MAKCFPVNSPEAMPPGGHEVSRKAGWEMVRRHREAHPNARSIAPQEWLTMRFSAKAISRLLKQKGAQLFAVHKAMYEDGTETLVLSAQDGDGNELKGGTVFLLNAGTPCPPDCPVEPPPPPPDEP